MAQRGLVAVCGMESYLGSAFVLHFPHTIQTEQRRVKDNDGQWSQVHVPVPSAVLDYNRFMGSGPVRYPHWILQSAPQDTEVVQILLLPLCGC